jgi:hypothetical protein
MYITSAATPSALSVSTPVQHDSTNTALTFGISDSVYAASISANFSEFTLTDNNGTSYPILGASLTDLAPTGMGQTLQLNTVPLMPGAYYLDIATGTDNNALVGRCFASLTDSLFFVISSMPVPPVLNGPADSVYVGDSASYWITGADYADSISWNLTGGTFLSLNKTMTDSAVVHWTAENAQLTVLVHYWGWTDTLVATPTVHGVGIAETPLHVRLYPNPVSGSFLYLDWSGTPLPVELWSLQGQQMGRFEGTREINLQGLPAGSYFLRCATSDGVIVQRFNKL